MEYFLKQEFDTFINYKGKDVNSVGQSEKQLIAQLNTKLAYLAELVKERLGFFSVKKAPHIINPNPNGGDIKKYLWYRIFPTEKWSELEYPSGEPHL